MERGKEGKEKKGVKKKITKTEKQKHFHKCTNTEMYYMYDGLLNITMV